ncbi:MAG: Sec-independent protein translocase TatB [Demequina sp.]|jgi:sec-independent protein translocase protein TatB|nr:Sec-independent protein translocase TatB [Demequina sp.]
MFGINPGEFALLALVAIIVIGPERLPSYSRQLREWIVRGRQMWQQGKQQIQAEVGEDIDWKSLDPRQYDPRRIVREALYEPLPTPGPVNTAGPASGQAPQHAPFDDDAT